MANPRVFISSTCYDLALERDSLLDFCASFGFEAALSERGDVFFHPDLHTHESCVNEIKNCHLLVLIVGGRFGGKYVVDNSKSITNAEFSAAKSAGIPIFTFIKSDVLQDHNTWQSNRDKPFVNDIHYPAIENQDHATSIFAFIDEIRRAKSNNSYFSFQLPKDIHTALRKQWAAMFLDFLQQKTLAQQISFTNAGIGKLAEATKKIEEIAQNIFRNSSKDNPQELIESIEQKSDARRLFTLIGSQISDNSFLIKSAIANEAANPSDTWWKLLNNCGFFAVINETDELGEPIKFLSYIGDYNEIPIEGSLTKKEESNILEYEASHRAFLKLNQQERFEIMSDFCHGLP
ncbi:DUF4062 domain-containing protein [Stenotrophomonas sp.]|uniref:DUF4062 domain-containing protein n=1 Tax=Stenotrophomonas sp. TaxID=69392 RepID=UPI0028AD7CDC|nr:DUF4062 domain-containing protein [Stenotrophomonas sp.]